MASAGPIVDFYVGVLGSAAGSRAFAAVGGQGPGVISASGVGTRELRKFMLELPATAKLRAIDLMFTDPALIAALMQKPGTAASKKRGVQKIIGMLQDKLFNNTVTMAPYVVRETFEEEDRGLDVPYQGFPGVPENSEKVDQQRIEQLQQQIQQQNMPPNNQQGALNPPVQTPTQNSGPALGPVNPPPAAVQTASQGSGPVDRTKFAALFPEDRELLGIGSLMGQA